MSKTIRPLVISATAAVLVVAAGAAFWNSTPVPPELDQRPSEPALTAAYVLPQSSVPTVVQRPLASGEPGIFQGFSTWSTTQRLTAVNAIMSSAELDLDVVAFLRDKLGDKKLPESVRNNIANTLIFQDRHDGQLAGRFLRMIDDTSESMTWRDYALQHAARALRFSDQPQPIIDRLLALMEKGEGSLPGTAILQLSMLDRDGVVPDLSKRIDLGILAMVTDDLAKVDNRMSAISTIGTRGMVDQIHLVRDLVRSNPDASLKRVALASLGQIGSDADIPLIQRYVDDKNTLVALAARGALTRVQAKSSL